MEGEKRKWSLQKFGNNDDENKISTKGQRAQIPTKYLWQQKKSILSICILFVSPTWDPWKFIKMKKYLQNKSKKWNVWQMPTWLSKQAPHDKSEAPHNHFSTACPIPESHFNHDPLILRLCNEVPSKHRHEISLHSLGLIIWGDKCSFGLSSLEFLPIN